MRILLTTLLLVTVISTALGQSRLGSSAAEIKQEFQGYGNTVNSDYSNEGTYYVTVDLEKAVVFYWFDEDFICVLCVVAPKNQGGLNFYVENYNSKYVVVSSTQWRMYYEGGYSDITLVFPEEGGYYFVWQ